jgi:hypothetical protein
MSFLLNINKNLYLYFATFARIYQAYFGSLPLLDDMY